MSDPTLIKSLAVFWDRSDPEIAAALKVPPEALPHRIAVKLLRELDRRHMQLQDKVAFERKHGLVDYIKLKKEKRNE